MYEEMSYSISTGQASLSILARNSSKVFRHEMFTIHPMGAHSIYHFCQLNQIQESKQNDRRSNLNIGCSCL